MNTWSYDKKKICQRTKCFSSHKLQPEKGKLIVTDENMNIFFISCFFFCFPFFFCLKICFIFCWRIFGGILLHIGKEPFELKNYLWRIFPWKFIFLIGHIWITASRLDRPVSKRKVLDNRFLLAVILILANKDFLCCLESIWNKI